MKTIPVPTLGQIVLYESKNGDGVKSPAIILRTRATTDVSLIERWGPGPEGTLSGIGKPDGLVAELPSDYHVDLLVHGLGGDYREYNVPHPSVVNDDDIEVAQVGLTGSSSLTARTWVPA